MQKWEKELNREGLTRAVEQQIREEAKAAKKYVVNNIIGDLLPILWEAEAAGKNVEYASWRWFFSVVESTLGWDKFRMIAEKYLEESRESNQREG